MNHKYQIDTIFINVKILRALYNDFNTYYHYQINCIIITIIRLLLLHYYCYQYHHYYYRLIISISIIIYHWHNLYRTFFNYVQFHRDIADCESYNRLSFHYIIHMYTSVRTKRRFSSNL